VKDFRWTTSLVEFIQNANMELRYVVYRSLTNTARKILHISNNVGINASVHSTTVHKKVATVATLFCR